MVEFQRMKDLLKIPYCGYSLKSWLILITGMLGGVAVATKMPLQWHLGIVPVGVLASVALNCIAIFMVGPPKKYKMQLNRTLPGTAKYLRMFSFCLLSSWIAWSLVYALVPAVHAQRPVFLIGLLASALVAWIVPALVCGATGVKAMRNELEAIEEQQIRERAQFLQKIKEAVSTCAPQSKY